MCTSFQKHCRSKTLCLSVTSEFVQLAPEVSLLNMWEAVLQNSLLGTAHLITEDLFKLFCFGKKILVSLYVCSLSFKLCLRGKNLFSIHFYCRRLSSSRASPVFPVRSKPVRLVRQGMFAGALAIQYKNTGSNLQRQY